LAAESLAKDVRLNQNAHTTNAAHQQCLAKMFADFMAAKARALHPKLADNVAPNLGLFMEMRQPVCAWSAASQAPS